MNPLLAIIIASAGIISAVSAAPASAHVLESQDTIGAVLHIDPDDDPVAGESTGIYFEFKDKTNRFKVQDCNCKLVVQQDNQTIYDQSFGQVAGGEFTFPERGVYVVKAIGSPKTASAFDAFELSYDVRVQRGIGQPDATSSTGKTKNIVLLVGGVVLVSSLLLAVRYKIMKKVT
ncbi:MAG: hypothetical protein ACR2FM_03235 [Candidatus Saccharimonadales bacterium]